MYCIGDATEFRAKRTEGNIYCDNDEMAPNISAATLSSNNMQDGDVLSLVNMTTKRKKKAQIPFSTFTILEYVRYTRALVDEKNQSKGQVVERLKQVGLNKKVRCKVKKLTPIEYRALSLATKLEQNTHTAYLNFEGLKYNKKNKKVLTRTLNHLASNLKVYALVDDARFVPKKA